MDFKTTTEYNFDVVKDFSIFNIFRVKFYRQVKWIFLAIALIVLAVCIFAAIEFQYYSLVAVAFLFLFLFFYLFFMLPKKAHSLSKGLKITYIFKDDGVVVLIVRPNGNVDSTQYSYDDFYIVYNTEKYIYLFLGKMQSYIIDKTVLSEQDATYLEEHIKSHVSDKIYKDWK